MNPVVHHINITVPRELEEECKNFYGVILGLTEIPKPAESRGRGGAWYQLGNLQLHLSREDTTDAGLSKRHICYTVDDLAKAEQTFRKAKIEILPDDNPMKGWARFYVRDPGGNKLEIAQAVEND